MQSVKIKNQPLQADKKYSLTTTSFVAEGGDGYSMLKDCKYLLEEAKAISHKTLVHKFFTVFDLKIEDEQLFAHIKAKMQEHNITLPDLIKDLPKY